MLRRLFQKIRPSTQQTLGSDEKEALKKFRKKYAQFRRLIEANAVLGGLMADLEGRASGDSLFTTMLLMDSASQCVRYTRRMVDSLIAMNPGLYKELGPVLDGIEHQLAETLQAEKIDRGDCPSYVLHLSEVDTSMMSWVGGKSASIGEIRSMLELDIPRGFAITTLAFQTFLEEADLMPFIDDALFRADLNNMEDLAEKLLEIRQRIEEAPLPKAVEDAITEAVEAVFGDEDVQFAVRSSAQMEDGEKSFAGQFESMLNVRRAGLMAAYKEVVGSLFTPSATKYRLHQGIPLHHSTMAVLVIEMVDAVAGGVAYSHDPVNPSTDSIIINGVLGLGRFAVDGVVSPDVWVLTREDEPSLIRRRASVKQQMLTIDREGRMVDVDVPEAAQKAFSLNDDEVIRLAKQVLMLDKHAGTYQDVEWAKKADGSLLILQSRPLQVRSNVFENRAIDVLPNHELLLEGGEVASAGVGFGPVVIPQNDEDLLNFPEGGVLVAHHSSAKYAMILDRAQAVITEYGGVTGHMATICREFRVPAVLSMTDATRKLQVGMVVTVDAFSGRVFKGKVEELLPLRLDLDAVRLVDTPIHDLLRAMNALIIPLNLTDPDSASFAPSSCKTLHDIMRYVHEHSYHEMFAISDSAADAGGMAKKLKASLPIDLHIIDLDKGLDAPLDARSVTPEQIVSIPMKSFLQGLLHPDVIFRKPRPVNMGGFLSVMSQQIATPQGGERFGDNSYAIVSDKYMNFSSRVGYHYSVLDAYCGNAESKNYISFSFQGGAAGEVRRVRRIKAIALVLENLGFIVSIKGDRVSARFAKYPRHKIEYVLDQLGRLVQVTRQLDMLMTSDAVIAQFAENFANGIYH